MRELEPIAVITTGGTIDKQYFDARNRYEIGEAAARSIFDAARVLHPFKMIGLLRKDSLELDDTDRAELLHAVERIAGTRIIITHGTDTMTRSAEVLSTVKEKTIVLVGALAPAIFARTDAHFNLGMAFACCQVAPPGIYITMNGTVFTAAEAIKDPDLGVFKSV